MIVIHICEKNVRFLRKKAMFFYSLFLDNNYLDIYALTVKSV